MPLILSYSIMIPPKVRKTDPVNVYPWIEPRWVPSGEFHTRRRSGPVRSGPVLSELEFNFVIFLFMNETRMYCKAYYIMIESDTSFNRTKLLLLLLLLT